MKNGLFSYFGNAYLTTFAPIDQLEKILSELKTEVSIEQETTEETTEQEEDRDEIWEDLSDEWNFSIVYFSDKAAVWLCCY